MKGNNGTGNTIERDSWRTNDDLFNNLNKQYEFDFDCCASKDNHKCYNYSADFEYLEDLKGMACWMNPPFSIARRMFEHFFKAVKTGVAIYRCDNMETKLWQEVILKNADWIFIPVGRVSYYSYEYMRKNNNKRSDSRFPSALIGVGVKAPKELDGYTLFVKNANHGMEEKNGN